MSTPNRPGATAALGLLLLHVFVAASSAQAPLRPVFAPDASEATGARPSIAGQDVHAPELKSENTALTLSLASTLTPLAAGILLMAMDDDSYDGSSTGEIGALVAGSALYFGPAVGYWYGGASGRGWKGVGLRFAVGAATTLGAVAICGDDRCSIWGDDGGATAGAALLILGGGAFILGSAIWDVAKVKSHVRGANEEKLRRAAGSLSLAPSISPANGGTIGIAGRIGLR